MSGPSDCGDLVEDISALEYARLNGLARNHFTDQSPFKILFNLQEAIKDLIIEDSDLPQLEFPPEHDLHERLSISQDGARLLAWAIQSEPAEAVDNVISSILGLSKSKESRVELPLLSSNHESDVIKFSKRDEFELRLQDVRLPLEVLDIEGNEAIEFPPSFSSLGTEILEEVRREKLFVTRDILQFLRKSITYDWDEIDEERLSGPWSTNRTVRLEPVTPPLSPIYLSINVDDPKMLDSIFEIPISSDPESLTCIELDRIEKEVFEHDIPTPIRNKIGKKGADYSLPNGENAFSSMTQLNSSASPSPTIEVDIIRRETLKVEEPLTPPIPFQIQKSVHFSDFVEEMLLGSSSSTPSDSFYGIALDPTIGDAAKRTTQQLEQQALVAADAVGRIEVPVMDFSYSAPPWRRLQDSIATSNLLLVQKTTIKEVVADAIPAWPGLNHGQQNLKWNPFSSDLGKMVINEAAFADDNTWQHLLRVAENGHVADTSALTWKPPGLKILREGEDEYIEQACFPSNRPQDIQVLARKRRMNFEPASNAQAVAPKPADSGLLGSNNETASFMRRTMAQNEFGLLMGDRFSAEHALDGFLELKGVKKQKLTNNPHLSKPVEEYPTRAHGTAPEIYNALECQAEIPPPRQPTSLPCPEIKPPATPISVIISSALLKNRALVKQIEAYLPSIKLIERDFTAHNKIAWMPNSVTRSPISSPLDSEADLIVSPSTGIILTTLQKVKQKSLPGQKSKPPIRDRLERASRRYEKLRVLVSESRLDGGTSGLSESDCDAFGEFVAFASGLDSPVMVHYVGGGVEALSRWLANSIAQHAGTNSSLLEEETHWELFLRRAGMNAFAAQYISAAMRTQTGSSPQREDQVDQYGIANFVLMGRQGRIDKFGDICGRKLLERVSNCLDRRWD